MRPGCARAAEWICVAALGLVLASGCVAATPATGPAAAMGALPEDEAALVWTEQAQDAPVDIAPDDASVAGDDLLPENRAPNGPVQVRNSSVTLPTYPVERFQKAVVDPIYHWPYKRFDAAAFKLANPSPSPVTYRTIELENDYLIVTVAPELGGRVLQVLHKASGTPMFYNNSVVKPTVWGPREQSGWTAVGGLEWCLPVPEHGYSWGEEWETEVIQSTPEYAAVRVSTPDDGRALRAEITIGLSADSAAFSVQPTITNLTDGPLRFDYWQNAMLAPGDGHRVTLGLHFVYPTRSMIVHSTGDDRLPASGQRLSWPIHEGRDVSELRTWREYAGLFESPAAHGPFAGVYDTIRDAGAVRAFPETVAKGSKLFALGGAKPLDPALYSDDDGSYVEIHGGLAPSFAQQVALGRGESVAWSEDWYPVVGMGDLDYADASMAIALPTLANEHRLTVYPVRDLNGTLTLEGDGTGEVSVAVHGNAGEAVAVTLPDGVAITHVTGVRLAGSDDATTNVAAEH